MRTLLALLLMLPLMAAAQTQGGLYYNPERDGEGASVFLRDEQAIILFYTFTDAEYIRPPEVSPSFPIGGPEVECVNAQTWYLGSITDWDGLTGSGKLYRVLPEEYPFVVAGTTTLGDLELVGFILTATDADGFDMIVEPLLVSPLPKNMYLFNTRFSFNNTLIEVKAD